MKNGPIIIIDDDSDDLDLMTEVLASLPYPNEVITFADSTKAIVYLRNSGAQPFLIISDINMPVLNGFALYDQIMLDNELHLKCVPFIYFTTAQAYKVISEAYRKSIRGFFVKGSDYDALRKRLSIIIEYWHEAITPGDVIY